ncbi:MAG: hypothetical protein KKD11_06585 [Candidatus Omnitrophica bacterium]|nr:hypothetical protein [Candidatus Omnitrophota bacterium]
MGNKKGVALFISLALLLLLSIGAIVFLLTAYNSVNINEAIARKKRAIIVAEAGINYAYWKIRINEDADGDPMSDYFPSPGTCTFTSEDGDIPISLLPDWTLQVDVVDSGTGRKTINSTVTYPKSSVF